jgi:hypothetical protein
MKRQMMAAKSDKELIIEQDRLILELREESMYLKGLLGLPKTFDPKTEASSPKEQAAAEPEEDDSSVEEPDPEIVSLKAMLQPVSCSTIELFTLENIKRHIDVGEYTYDMFLNHKLGLVDFVMSIAIQNDQQNYVCVPTDPPSFFRLVERGRWSMDGDFAFLREVLNLLREQVSSYSVPKDVNTREITIVKRAIDGNQRYMEELLGYLGRKLGKRLFVRA